MAKKTERSSVLLIYTGGTIGMMQDAGSGQLKPFNFNHLSAQIPELKKFDLTLSSVSFDKPIDSSNMNPDIWLDLARMIRDNYELYDGFVILHGSDTMAFTASALSFLLANLAKPVVLTGSQLPMGIIRTDGKENLITAIEIASAKRNGKAIVPEVSIYFEYQLYRGNRTHKFNSEHFQAFQSPNYPVLAEAGVHIKYQEQAIFKPKGKLKVHTSLNRDIVILKLFPGITEQAVNAILNIRNLKAVILETYGSGNASTEKWFLQALKKTSDKGIIIFNVTQCSAGSVIQGKYQTSSALKEIGVIGGSDITTEAAVTKLMFILGQGLTLNNAKKNLGIPLRGEMN